MILDDGVLRTNQVLIDSFKKEIVFRENHSHSLRKVTASNMGSNLIRFRVWDVDLVPEMSQSGKGLFSQEPVGDGTDQDE